MAITVDEYFSDATLEIASTIGLDCEYTICEDGVLCPALAGVRQTLSVTIEEDQFKQGKSGHVKLEIYHSDDDTRVDLYCVAFAAKVV